MEVELQQVREQQAEQQRIQQAFEAAREAEKQRTNALTQWFGEQLGQAQLAELFTTLPRAPFAATPMSMNALIRVYNLRPYLTYACNLFFFVQAPSVASNDPNANQEHDLGFSPCAQCPSS